MDTNDSPILNQKFTMITYVDNSNIKFVDRSNNKINNYKYNFNKGSFLSAKMPHNYKNNYKNYGLFDTCEEAIEYMESLNCGLNNCKLISCFDTYEEAIKYANELSKKSSDYDYHVAEIIE